MAVANTGITIQFGDYYFTDENNDIINGSGATHQALIAESLSADECTFTVKINAAQAGLSAGYYIDDPGTQDDGYLYTRGGLIFSVNTNRQVEIEDFEDFDYATPISIYEDGALLYVYYVTNIAPLTKLQDNSILIKFTCISFVGLTCYMQHDGGIYQNSSVEAIIAEILNATKNNTLSTAQLYWYDMPGGFHYTIDKQVAITRMDGHLPATSANENRSARDNIRDVLFACGASILKQADGSIYFTYNQPDTPTAISDDVIYQGDSYTTSEKVTKVSVIEHAYYQISGTEDTVLYDTGAEIVDHIKVLFDEPCYAIHAEDSSTMTVNSSGANFAIITGAGKLLGKKYTHTQQEYTEETGIIGAENVRTADNGLISLLNYLNVLERLKNYYSTAREISASFKMQDGVKTGSLIAFNDPIGRQKTGIIKDLNFTMSRITKADATIVADWLPTEVGNNFEFCDILTGSGSWSKAAAESRAGKTINNIRIVVIGAGNGGGNGANGQDGSGSTGGAGGQGGAGGLCGKVKTVNLNAADGDTIPNSLTYSCGAGGGAGASGGASEVVNGALSYKSSDADAVRPAYGYINLITGDIYCQNGEAGQNGGNGGNGGSAAVIQSSNPTPDSSKGKAGGNVGSYTGGVGGSGHNSNIWSYYSNVSINTSKNNASQPDWIFSTPQMIGFGGSGGGGGAALGANGGNGVQGTGTALGGYNNSYTGSRQGSGRGGDGANAISPSNNSGYGNGGNGGHGGGGGGGRGNANNTSYKVLNGYWASPTQDTRQITNATAYAVLGRVGTGGNGSSGTPGGAGLVIIYY